MGYSKLHSSLVNSSLWNEPDNVRILFITLLAICNWKGEVYGSRAGIERVANIRLENGSEPTPWEVLMSPDSDSSDRLRNPENEGRRIQEIPGGFRIINYDYYRGIRNEDDRREQNRRAQQKHRERAGDRQHTSPNISMSAHADADAEKERNKEKDQSQRHKQRQSSAVAADSEDLTEEQRDTNRKKLLGLGAAVAAKLGVESL